MQTLCNPDDAMTETSEQTPTSREWNYHPELPLQDPSVFRWPPEPGFLMRWFARNWLNLSERMLLLIAACLAWWFLYPSLESAQTLAFAWVFQVWIVNLALMVATAGSLHWFFWGKQAQGTELKFERRDMGKNNRLWSFSDQVKDNVFWSLTSGVGQLTVFQCVVLWAMANGYAPVITFSENPVWFVLAIMVLPIWSAFHFYWVHRLLHVPFLYTHVHSLHHRNVNIGPWSGLSMHPVEHLLYLSTLLIHLIVPSHPIHLVFHVMYQGPGAAMTHTGYEDLLIRDKRRLALGTCYHQLHHRFYECNYGNQEMPWDRWFGTFHNGSEDATAETRARKKAMYAMR